jgi:hypothetical protein
MPDEKWGVAKGKGIDPEQFFIFLMKPDGTKGSLMRTSGFFSEDELRAELAISGSAEAEIDNLIETARSNSV